MGKICMNATWNADFAVMTSEAFMMLSSSVGMQLEMYSACGLNGYGGIQIDGAEQVRSFLT